MLEVSTYWEVIEMERKGAWEMVLIGWHCFIKQFALREDKTQRCEAARITHSRLKTVMERKPNLFPVASNNSLMATLTEDADGRIPYPHEFKEVLGVDPIEHGITNEGTALSHISQYRLAVYVASVIEQEDSIDMNPPVDATMCA
ncbi:MAG: hypothetical protein JST01_07680 [Cyanobacteria bacterium SZAS TMP-1]|nr:hypothetical protein [Cyanobacteria bacterium SZAS TMP-1]